MAAVPARWHPEIEPQSAPSWLAFACYAAACAVVISAVVVARRNRRVLVGVDQQESRCQSVLGRCFLVVAVIVAALWLSRQLDLQTAVVDRMRRIAWEGGWYQRRREYQAEVIAGLVVVGALVAAGIALLLRRIVRRVAPVLVGVGLLTGFAVVRAISFHYVDAVLRQGGSVSVNAVSELGLLALIVGGTVKWHLDERRLVAIALAAQPSASLALSIP